MAEIDDVFRLVEVEHDSRTYQFPRPSYGTEGAYSRHLKRSALRDLAAVRQGADVETYQDVVRAVADGFASGRYDWGGKVWLESLDQSANLVELSWLMATQVKGQEDVKRKDVEALCRARRGEVAQAVYDLLFGPTPPMPPAQEGQPGATDSASPK